MVMGPSWMLAARLKQLCMRPAIPDTAMSPKRSSPKASAASLSITHPLAPAAMPSDCVCTPSQADPQDPEAPEMCTIFPERRNRLVTRIVTIEHHPQLHASASEDESLYD